MGSYTESRSSLQIIKSSMDSLVHTGLRLCWVRSFPEGKEAKRMSAEPSVLPHWRLKSLRKITLHWLVICAIHVFLGNTCTAACRVVNDISVRRGTVHLFLELAIEIREKALVISKASCLLQLSLHGHFWWWSILKEVEGSLCCKL